LFWVDRDWQSLAMFSLSNAKHQQELWSGFEISDYNKVDEFIFILFKTYFLKFEKSRYCFGLIVSMLAETGLYV
jgi:hypothetical protein